MTKQEFNEGFKYGYKHPTYSFLSIGGAIRMLYKSRNWMKGAYEGSKKRFIDSHKKPYKMSIFDRFII